MNRTEAMEKMCTASSVVKLTCGICNNAAWLVCLDAMNKLKQHARWKQRLRGGHTVCGCYKNAIRLFHVYERRLIYSDAPRFSILVICLTTCAGNMATSATGNIMTSGHPSAETLTLGQRE